MSLIITPTLLTLGFSYMLGGEMKYSIGIVNNDNGMITDSLLEKIESSGNFNLKYLEEDTLDSAIVGKEIEVALIFEDDFSKKIINGEESKVNLKAVGESEIKSTLTSLINTEVLTLNTLGSLANGDINRFEELLKEYDISKPKYILSEVQEREINVYASVGIQIMMIMMSGFFITRFIIDDEVQGTKSRILLGKVSKFSYFTGNLITFYLCSAISSFFYFGICNLLGFDFMTNDSWLFLIVLLALNLFSISFNLSLVTLSKNPQVASTLATICTVAGSMICGLFWPFSVMPEEIQKIGNLIPLRWAGIAFEKIQVSGGLTDISKYLIGIILVSLILLGIPIVKRKK